MDTTPSIDELKRLLPDREWRLNNLYWIVDKEGQVIKLKLNPFQRYVLKNLWFLNLILKARQLGMSTFIDIFILDCCIFTPNLSAGIIDATLPDAKKKLKKIKFAYEHMPNAIRREIRLSKDNEQKLEFSNGSIITADTTFRGDTVQYLHISEYGKICKDDPIKAREIKTGALNAVAMGQFIFIESTAEDAEGHFYELCELAKQLKIENKKLTELDYRFFFFPWWKHPGYALEMPDDEAFSNESNKYFRELEQQGITLTTSQKYWYVKKKESQGSDMKREYPSTPKEAFEVATEDKYYKEIMLELRGKNQICEFDIAAGVEINLDFDLGYDDYTAIVFSQTVGKEIHIVDYIEANNEKLEFYADLIKRKGYLLGTLWLPHDSKQERVESEKSSFRKLKALFPEARVDIVPGLAIEQGIDEVRRILPYCWFRRSTTAQLIDHLEKYGRKWSEQLGQYTGPKHNEHSHAADAFRGLAVRFKENRTQMVKKQIGRVSSMLQMGHRFQ